MAFFVESAGSSFFSTGSAVFQVQLLGSEPLVLRKAGISRYLSADLEWLTECGKTGFCIVEVFIVDFSS